MPPQFDVIIPYPRKKLPGDEHSLATRQQKSLPERRGKLRHGLRNDELRKQANTSKRHGAFQQKKSYYFQIFIIDYDL
jgi:hypothetical protein